MTDDDQDVTDQELQDVEIIDEYDDEMGDQGFHGPEFAVGLIVGLALGAAVALLAAPQTGVRTRRQLGRKARKIRREVEDKWDGAQRELRRNTKRRKRQIRGRVDKAAKRTRKVIERLT